MKDLFVKRNDDIVAKLITVREGMGLPMFSKAIVMANTHIKYRGIPVFVLDGYMFSYDSCSGDIQLTGEMIEVNDLTIMKDVTNAINDIADDLSASIKSDLSFIIVYVDNDLDGIVNKSNVIKLDKLGKFKIRGRYFKLSGISKELVSEYKSVSSKKKVAYDDADDTKSFVIDEKEELI